MKAAGTLYVVATPIGNLKDITLRAIETLKNVDLILAESPAHTRALLTHYGITSPVMRFNQHTRQGRLREFLSLLMSGKDLALVSSAGTPCVSDPGSPLVRCCLDEGIRVSPIPGPSAITAAYSVSGMASGGFVFAGFLSPRRGKRQKELMSLKETGMPVVLYESCHRIQGALEDILHVFGNMPMVMVREVTKIYEEILSGSVGDILTSVLNRELKGEITLILGCRQDR